MVGVLDLISTYVHTYCMPKPSNRPKLLAVGLGLVHERGYASTSVRDIVQAAGVPQGCFTNHFATKEAFGVEVINQHFSGTTKLLDRTLRNEGLPPLERLEAYFDATIEHLQGNAARKGCLFGNFGIEASPHSEAIRERIVEVFGEMEAAIELCLEAAVTTGDLPASSDCNDLAALIMSSLQGATLLAKTRRSAVAIEAVKRVVFTKILMKSNREHLSKFNRRPKKKVPNTTRNRPTMAR